jgi:hypothetical protein
MAYNPADLPNRVIAERVVYSSVRDVINVGNAHYHFPWAIDGMTEPISTVQFNYPRTIDLFSSLGMQIRVSTQNDTPMTGEFCTITFSTTEEEE